MSNVLVRFISALLSLCLLWDPATASALSAPPTKRLNSNAARALFAQEAIVQRVLGVLHPLDDRKNKTRARQVIHPLTARLRFRIGRETNEAREMLQRATLPGAKNDATERGSQWIRRATSATDDELLLDLVPALADHAAQLHAARDVFKTYLGHRAGFVATLREGGSQIVSFHLDDMRQAIRELDALLAPLTKNGRLPDALEQELEFANAAGFYLTGATETPFGPLIVEDIAGRLASAPTLDPSALILRDAVSARLNSLNDSWWPDASEFIRYHYFADGLLQQDFSAEDKRVLAARYLVERVNSGLLSVHSARQWLENPPTINDDEAKEIVQALMTAPATEVNTKPTLEEKATRFLQALLRPLSVARVLVAIISIVFTLFTVSDARKPTARHAKDSPSAIAGQATNEYAVPGVIETFDGAANPAPASSPQEVAPGTFDVDLSNPAAIQKQLEKIASEEKQVTKQLQIHQRQAAHVQEQVEHAQEALRTLMEQPHSSLPQTPEQRRQNSQAFEKDRSSFTHARRAATGEFLAATGTAGNATPGIEGRGLAGFSNSIRPSLEAPTPGQPVLHFEFPVKGFLTTFTAGLFDGEAWIGDLPTAENTISVIDERVEPAVNAFRAEISQPFTPIPLPEGLAPIVNSAELLNADSSAAIDVREDSRGQYYFWVTDTHFPIELKMQLKATTERLGRFIAPTPSENAPMISESDLKADSQLALQNARRQTAFESRVGTMIGHITSTAEYTMDDALGALQHGYPGGYVVGLEHVVTTVFGIDERPLQCSSADTLLAAYLRLLGFSVRIRTGYFSPGETNEIKSHWRHAQVEVFNVATGQWVVFDPTPPDRDGKETSRYFNDLPIDSDALKEQLAALRDAETLRQHLFELQSRTAADQRRKDDLVKERKRLIEAIRLAAIIPKYSLTDESSMVRFLIDKETRAISPLIEKAKADPSSIVADFASTKSPSLESMRNELRDFPAHLRTRFLLSVIERLMDALPPNLSPRLLLTKISLQTEWLKDDSTELPLVFKAVDVKQEVPRIEILQLFSSVKRVDLFGRTTVEKSRSPAISKPLPNEFSGPREFTQFDVGYSFPREVNPGQPAARTAISLVGGAWYREQETPRPLILGGSQKGFYNSTQVFDPSGMPLLSPPGFLTPGGAPVATSGGHLYVFLKPGQVKDVITDEEIKGMPVQIFPSNGEALYRAQISAGGPVVNVINRIGSTQNPVTIDTASGLRIITKGDQSYALYSDGMPDRRLYMRHLQVVNGKMQAPAKMLPDFLSNLTPEKVDITPYPNSNGQKVYFTVTGTNRNWVYDNDGKGLGNMEYGPLKIGSPVFSKEGKRGVFTEADSYGAYLRYIPDDDVRELHMSQATVLARIGSVSIMDAITKQGARIILWVDDSGKSGEIPLEFSSPISEYVVIDDVLYFRATDEHGYSSLKAVRSSGVSSESWAMQTISSKGSMDVTLPTRFNNTAVFGQRTWGFWSYRTIDDQTLWTDLKVYPIAKEPGNFYFSATVAGRSGVYKWDSKAKGRSWSLYSANGEVLGDTVVQTRPVPATNPGVVTGPIVALARFGPDGVRYDARKKAGMKSEIQIMRSDNQKVLGTLHADSIYDLVFSPGGEIYAVTDALHTGFQVFRVGDDKPILSSIDPVIPTQLLFESPSRAILFATEAFTASNSEVFSVFENKRLADTYGRPDPKFPTSKPVQASDGTVYALFREGLVRVRDGQLVSRHDVQGIEWVNAAPDKTIYYGGWIGKRFGVFRLSDGAQVASSVSAIGMPEFSPGSSVGIAWSQEEHAAPFFIGLSGQMKGSLGPRFSEVRANDAGRVYPMMAGPEGQSAILFGTHGDGQYVAAIDPAQELDHLVKQAAALTWQHPQLIQTAEGKQFLQALADRVKREGTFADAYSARTLLRLYVLTSGMTTQDAIRDAIKHRSSDREFQKEARSELFQIIQDAFTRYRDAHGSIPFNPEGLSSNGRLMGFFNRDIQIGRNQPLRWTWRDVHSAQSLSTLNHDVSTLVNAHPWMKLPRKSLKGILLTSTDLGKAWAIESLLRSPVFQGLIVILLSAFVGRFGRRLNYESQNFFAGVLEQWAWDMSRNVFGLESPSNFSLEDQLKTLPSVERKRLSPYAKTYFESDRNVQFAVWVILGYIFTADPASGVSILPAKRTWRQTFVEAIVPGLALRNIRRERRTADRSESLGTALKQTSVVVDKSGLAYYLQALGVLKLTFFDRYYPTTPTRMQRREQLAKAA